MTGVSLEHAAHERERLRARQMREARGDALALIRIVEVIIGERQRRNAGGHALSARGIADRAQPCRPVHFDVGLAAADLPEVDPALPEMLAHELKMRVALRIAGDDPMAAVLRSGDRAPARCRTGARLRRSAVRPERLRWEPRSRCSRPGAGCRHRSTAPRRRAARARRPSALPTHPTRRQRSAQNGCASVTSIDIDRVRHVDRDHRIRWL